MSDPLNQSQFVKIHCNGPGYITLTNYGDNQCTDLSTMKDIFHNVCKSSTTSGTSTMYTWSGACEPGKNKIFLCCVAER